VVVHAGSGDVQALYGYDATSSTFGATAALTVGTNPVAVALADLNGDCVQDVVVANQGSDDLSVTFGTPSAQAQSFGSGCAGTGGLVPALAATGGAPTVGNNAFGTELTQARSFAPCLMLWSASQATLALGDCEVLVGLPAASALRFTDGSGTDTWTFGIPNDPALLCVELFFQASVFDPNGSFSSLLAFSDAMRLRIGQ
ncbi:MAG: hypothetical protein KDA22_01505, partial [Phycisphaerales bacterium]|nr:hypothetical protein [Phycisphaerales bacterium]